MDLLSNRTDNHAHTNYNDSKEMLFAYTLKILLPKPWEGLPEPKTLGENIRLARLKRGWQIKELAKKADADEASIINREKNHNKPKYPYVRKLKEILPEIALLSPSLFYPDYPVDPKNYAERVKQERLNLGLSQTELAHHLGLCVDTIRDRESGRCLRPLPIRSSPL